MRYLITSRKPITLQGVVRKPGEFLEDPVNAGILIRRGLAVPFGIESEQAETLSPSSEPAPTPPTDETPTEDTGGQGETENTGTEESSPDGGGEDSSETPATASKASAKAPAAKAKGK